MKKNIFFIHTPYHVRVVADIVAERNCINNIFVVEIADKTKSSWYLSRLKGVAQKIIFVDLIRPQTIGFGVRNRMERSIKKIKSEISFEEADLYFSDINWPMNNYFFFWFSGKGNRYIFEDGSANYVSVRKNVIDYCRGELRRLLSCLRIGAFFKNWIGEKIGGDHPEVKLNFFYRPELSGTKGNKIKIDFHNINIMEPVVIPDNSLVFLEQPHLKKVNYEKLNYAIQILMKEARIDNFFIKKHHFSDSKDRDILNGYLDITSPGPIEDYIIGENCIVIAFSSSALFNLKAIYGDSIECVAVDFFKFCHSVRIPQKKAKELCGIYTSVGVRFLD